MNFKYEQQLEDIIARQKEEITRLLAENAELKKDLEYYHTGTDTCDIESAIAAGHEEAWELAKKIALLESEGGYSSEELDEIFGRRQYLIEIFNLTYHEVAAKVAEWERKKEEICVGDVVRFKSNNRVEFCVTNILDDRFLYGVSAEGDVYADRNIKLFEKTGRHIDIASMLAQIGGER